MHIGILGAGMIGATAARLFVKAGHQVTIANRRGPESLAGLISELGDRARAVALVDEAAEAAEMVLLAVPWRSAEALPSPETVAGKIVIDAMNPYRPDGGIYNLGDSSSSEETQKRLPGARLVKAFNTIYFVHLAEQGRPDLAEEERRAIPVASDDSEAKAVVSRLIAEIGFGPVDNGSLREGGLRQQPGTAIYNRDLTVREAREILRRS